MPVIIINNSVTELYIIKEQEGTVADWQSAKGVHMENLYLILFFVKLNNSPQLVKFNGLSENVVPLVKSTVSTSVQLASGRNILIFREQVEVLL